MDSVHVFWVLLGVAVVSSAVTWVATWGYWRTEYARRTDEFMREQASEGVEIRNARVIGRDPEPVQVDRYHGRGVITPPRDFR